MKNSRIVREASSHTNVSSILDYELLGIMKVDPSAKLPASGNIWDSEVFNQYKQKNELKNKNLQDEEETIVSAGKCIFCKSEKTTSRAVQTRSGDEGMSFIIFCYDCNRTQKI